MTVVPSVDKWEMLEIGLVLTQPINHGPWIVHMGYLVSKFKFKLIDIGMIYQYQQWSNLNLTNIDMSYQYQQQSNLNLTDQIFQGSHISDSQLLGSKDLGSKCIRTSMCNVGKP